jgi:hypothetical protein
MISPYVYVGIAQVDRPTILKATFFNRQDINYLRTAMIPELEQILGIEPGLLISRYRGSHVVCLRKALMHYLRKEGYKLSNIGRLFNRDHSTVIHSRDCVEDVIMNPDTNLQLYAAYEKVKSIKVQNCIAKYMYTIENRYIN